MEMLSGKVWLRQALSDLACAEFLETKPEMRCHAIAKYQQALEKGVKALATAVNDNTKTQITIRLTHDVEAYINIMQRLPSKQNSNIPQRIRSLFNARDMSILYELVAQAPRSPGTGRYARNTEYPFQDADNKWIAPCDTDIYSEEELRKWGRLTTKTVEEVERLVDVLYRSKKK